MGCILVTHFGLTNIAFCILYVRMNHCETHLMGTSKVIASKGFKMAIYSWGIFPDKLKRQNGTCNVTWFQGDHTQKSFIKLQANKDCYKYSFLPRTVID